MVNHFNYRVHLIYKVRPLKMVVERTEGPSLGNGPAAQKYVSKYHGDDLSPDHSSSTKLTKFTV